MQQNQLTNKQVQLEKPQQQQEQQQQQQQRTSLLNASGQNALSESQHHSASSNSNSNNNNSSSKLAANKIQIQSSDAGGIARPALTATDAIRRLRFRAQICVNAKRNNKTNNAQATSKTQDLPSPFDVNGKLDEKEKGNRQKYASPLSTACATTAAATESHPSVVQQELSQETLLSHSVYYKLNCRTNYGDFHQVQVQFHSSNRQCCSFSWKSKFRRYSVSSTTAKRKNPPQATSRRKRRNCHRRQRYGLWLKMCGGKQEKEQRWSRHDSLPSSDDMQTNDGEVERVQEEDMKKVRKVAEEKVAEKPEESRTGKKEAKEKLEEEKEHLLLTFVEGIEENTANTTLIALENVDNEVNDDTNDLLDNSADSITSTCVKKCGERALQLTTTQCHNPDNDEGNLLQNYFMETHNQVIDENCVVVATEGGGTVNDMDLIDFTNDDLFNRDTFAITDSDTTITNVAFDAAISGSSIADAEIMPKAYVEPTATPHTNTIVNDNSASGDVNVSSSSSASSSVMIAAEVSGDFLLVGDCKGVVDAQEVQKKMKVNQSADIAFSDEWNRGTSSCCGCEQLTTECGDDQNRGIGSVSTKSVKHTTTDTPTELREIHHNNNNSITNTTTAATSNGTATRTNSQTPSPILGHHGKKTTTTTQQSTATSTTASVAVGGMLLEKKSQSKLLSTRGKTLLQKSHQQQRSAEETPASSHGGGVGGGSVVAERLDAAELQRLKYLNRHSCNGRLDYEAIERHLEQTELQEVQRNKSIEVLGVLLQYAVHDLDAFACPRVKAEKNKIQTYLNTTLRLLDDAKTTCTRLQDQLCDKEGYYSQREEDLQALHRCEIEKAKVSLSEYQTFAQKKFAELETQLDAKDVEHKRVLDSYRLELDNKLAQKQQQLEAAEERELQLKQRLSALTISERELSDKLMSVESSYSTRLQSAAEREFQLNERLKTLTKELDSLRASKQNRERELRDKLNLSQDEISVLRSSQRSFNESLDRSSSGFGSPRNSSTSELARLQSEADSLHCVLELKQKEISKLTKQNEELMRDAEERAVLQGKISLLESNNEMLKSELEIKSEKEKDFLRQMDDMQKAYNHEMVKRKRLSYDNEALQWQLKQRSEQLHIVETKLQELSAQESINASNLSSLGSLNRSQLLNGSSLVNIQMDDISPPTSPVVKGVIEKPDSVSWVLEMDDETPEAAASKMVKRAGSFRSVERSPSTRRQLSACSSVMNTSLNSVGSNNGGGASYGNGNGNSNGNGATGPNPLSQSMSATSVIRQHSSDVRHEFNNRSHSRIRSKSVSVKGSEPPATPTVTPANNTTSATGSIGTKSGKKVIRQSTGSTHGARKQHQLELINWIEPTSSSSPHPNVIRPRTSTMCSEVAEEQQVGSSLTSNPSGEHDQTLSMYARTPTSSSSNRKLITCDTSKLNSGERLDMQSLPTHTSVHDLKKKFNEIQESAGEAMVSGTNSEDEGCSASSDEIVCSVSTSSATTGSTSSLKNSHMSLEEVLFFDKINSLNGTPMEVSWSDDQEVFTSNGSTV